VKSTREEMRDAEPVDPRDVRGDQPFTAPAVATDKRGRIRWLPEAHCDCGRWDSLADAEGHGNRGAVAEAKRLGWTFTRAHGWRCPGCSS
jgi:hypothetical protein